MVAGNTKSLRKRKNKEEKIMIIIFNDNFEKELLKKMLQETLKEKQDYYFSPYNPELQDTTGNPLPPHPITIC